jgi:hypothetical protein
VVRVGLGWVVIGICVVILASNISGTMVGISTRREEELNNLGI